VIDRIRGNPGALHLVPFILPALLLVGVFLSYRAILETFFVQDDFWFLQAVSLPGPNRMMLTGILPDFFRPLPTYWFPRLNAAVWGLDPYGHHLSQMVVFLLAVWILYQLLLNLSASHLAAAAGTALYGLAKVHLYTLGWIAGAIDILAAFFFILSMWLLVLYRQDRAPLWAAGASFGLALLSKESSAVLPLAFTGGIALESLAAGRWPERKDWRVVVMLAAVLLVYAAVWLLHTSQALAVEATWGFAPGRSLTVLSDSLAAVLPGGQFYGGLPLWWLLLPVLLFGSTAWLLWSKPERLYLLLSALLWLLPAAIFSFTVKPVNLQPYYAHFSLFGLAGLAALSLSAMGRLFETRRTKLAWQFGLLAALIVYGYNAALVVQDGIARADSPSLYEARYSEQAYRQIQIFMQGDSFQEIVFLETSELIWWATGKGAMIPVLFPGVSAYFDGYGYRANPQLKTGAGTLVIRQTGELTFEPVH
jgi:4-amino-4-deoxy-L-arabinose transferase-like glycosyltransferase